MGGSCHIFRGYSQEKLQENLDAEIFEVLLDEARGAYDEEIVVELHSETDDHIDSNCSRIVAWIESWKQSQTTNSGWRITLQYLLQNYVPVFRQAHDPRYGYKL